MKLFVGLGNPGSKYERNRHNVGFMAVDRIADAHGFGNWRRRFQGHTSDGTISGERVILLKPDTYMNESGRSVGEAARFLKIPEADIVVFYDEIDLAPGKLKVKTGGGNAGHNGLRSMSAHLGNDYVRVRIGVGHPGRKDLVAHYVLHDFAKSDHDWLDPLLDEISKAVGHLTRGDASRFLGDVARGLPAADSDKPAKPAGTKAASERTPSRDAGADATAGPKASATRGAFGAPGERGSKRATALADNLQKWLKGRHRDDTN